MKSKKPLLLLLILLAIPICYADDCGITNLATCLPQKLFEYFLTIVNAPFQPFLSLVQNLLSGPVNVATFMPLWSIIIYIISIFYSIFLLVIGFNFIISGYSAGKRETAKEWLRNTVLMILFVQASFFLYSLLIDLSAQLTTGVFNLIDPNFFLLTADSLPSFALELVFSILYLIALLLCIMLLSIRHIIVAVGVVCFPIAIFFSFVPPLKSYGSLMINILLMLIFLPFFESIILLASSMMITLPIFQNFKILLMTAAFLLVSLSIIILVLFAIAKAAFSLMHSAVGKSVRLVSGGL